MIPFLVFRKNYVVKRTPYELFNKINEQVYDGRFGDIKARFEDNQPPVFRLEIKKNQLGIKPKVNAILWIKIEDAENGSNINIALYSSTSTYIFLAVFLVSIIVNIIRLEERMLLVLFSTLLFLAFAMMDIYARKEILKRFEELISGY